MSDVNRFWSYVEVRSKEECWPWISKSVVSKKTPYGRFSVKKVKYSSHRIAYYLQHGKDPGKILVCHICDNPRCCNASHLFLGSYKDNSVDAVQKGRIKEGENHGRAKLTSEQILLIRSTYRNPHTAKQLVALYGVSLPTVYAVLTGKTRTKEGGNIKKESRQETHRGTRNGAAKLTEEKVKSIVADLQSSGFSGAEIGRKYGVSRFTISMIKRRRIWRHVLVSA